MKRLPAIRLRRHRIVDDVGRTDAPGLADRLQAADAAWFYAPPDLGWDLPSQVTKMGARAHFSADVNQLADAVGAAARAGDHVLIMSNGGFGGLHDKLLKVLQKRNS